MKILVFIPVFKRPEVLNICLEGLDWFSSQVTWDVEAVCLLSPEDPDLKKNEKLVKMYDHKAIYYKNLPVADKMNAGLQWIAKNRKFDYLMNFGSDDLIHPKIEALYKEMFAKHIPFFGINTLFFYDLASKKTFHFDTFANHGSIGAGRMVHYSIVKQFADDMMPLYEPGLNSGLDCSSSRNIKRNLSAVDVIVDSGEFPYIVDIKTNTNINHILHIETRQDHIKYYPKDYLPKYFPCLR